MRRLRLVETTSETIELGGRALTLVRPARPETLLDEERFADDEFLPYWAEPWPSGLALARHVAALDVAGLRVVELGCGLGLPSLVAAAGGAKVLATDWAPEAVDLLRANAARNAIDLRAECLDWRDVEAFVARGPFDVVLGADIVYEQRNVAPLHWLLMAVTAVPGAALIADPGRRQLAAFLAAFRPSGWHLDELETALLPRGAIHRLRRSPA